MRSSRCAPLGFVSESNLKLGKIFGPGVNYISPINRHRSPNLAMPANDVEKHLVQQVRAGDAQAWQQLIERYEGRLLAFVESRLHDRSTSEDTVQETFIGFLTSLPHFDENRDLEAYLFSIAAHKLTDHLRRQGRRPIDQFGSDDEGRPLDEVPGGARAASSIARSDERRLAEERLLNQSMGLLIREWLDRGDYDRVKCLELLLVKGWANKDAARFLGLTEQAVASYKFQAIARLKDFARRAGLSLDDHLS
jgi:RNA polymerase sigma-70 factor (ECF subfamily)